MKKVHFLGMICLMALFLSAVVCCTEKETNGDSGNGNGNSNGGGSTGEYVDLGLPSGTKWKNENEVNAADTVDFYTYDEAVAAFGNALPTREQFEELKDSCQWSQTESGYTVTGPNGNSIVLPAAGYRDCDGTILAVGYGGSYWSSTPFGSSYAWRLQFLYGTVDWNYTYRCKSFSVRLVQNQ